MALRTGALYLHAVVDAGGSTRIDAQNYGSHSITVPGGENAANCECDELEQEFSPEWTFPTISTFWYRVLVGNQCGWWRIYGIPRHGRSHLS